MAACLKCPRCGEPFATSSLEGRDICQCPRCPGNWLDIPTFYNLGSDAQRGREMMRHGQPVGDGYMSVSRLACCECGRMMRRFNYAVGTGVHLDFCKEHGVWLDQGELARMVDFIKHGPPPTREYARPASLVPPSQSNYGGEIAFFFKNIGRWLLAAVVYVLFSGAARIVYHYYFTHYGRR